MKYQISKPEGLYILLGMTVMLGILLGATTAYSQTYAITGTRQLPSTYTPEQSFTVSIDVVVNYSVDSFILREYFPAGWSVSNIIPNPDKVSTSSGYIKWLFMQNEVKNQTLYYTLTPPSGASGYQSFNGEILYIDVDDSEVTVSVGGDTGINEAGAPTATPSMTPTCTPASTKTPTKGCLLGDTDCNGDITPGDALIAFQIYLGLHEPSGNESCDVMCAADWDKNSDVTPGDALCIFKEYLQDPC